MEWLSTLQWLNPCAAVAHASSAAAGFQPERFWGYLGATHGLGWLFAGAAGLLLPWANRCQAGRTPSKRWSWFSSVKSTSFESRKRLLERNPFLWLNSRDRWASTMVWLWVVLPAAGWSWFIWLTWVLRGLNVIFVFVIAIGLSWAMTLACMVPAHAARQMVADRLSGVLEVVLCAPITPKLIAQGTWMALRRYFLMPVSAVLGAGAILMISGYVTFGFGGMFDTEDRTHWLWAWLTGILFVPPALWALCWVSLPARAVRAESWGGECDRVRASVVHGLLCSLADFDGERVFKLSITETRFGNRRRAVTSDVWSSGSAELFEKPAFGGVNWVVGSRTTFAIGQDCFFS